MTKRDSTKDDGSIVNGRQCPNCGDVWQNKVIDTRTDRLKEKNLIVRRRECLLCGCRWSTIEVNRMWFKLTTKRGSTR